MLYKCSRNNVIPYVWQILSWAWKTTEHWEGDQLSLGNETTLKYYKKSAGFEAREAAGSVEIVLSGFRYSGLASGYPMPKLHLPWT